MASLHDLSKQPPPGVTWSQVGTVAKYIAYACIIGFAFYGVVNLWRGAGNGSTAQKVAQSSTNPAPAASPPGSTPTGNAPPAGGGGAADPGGSPPPAPPQVAPDPATAGQTAAGTGAPPGKKQAQTFPNPAPPPPQGISSVKEIPVSPRNWNFHGIESRVEWTVATDKDGWLPNEADFILSDVVHLNAGKVYRVKTIGCLPSAATLWMVTLPASNAQARSKEYTPEQLAGGVHLYTPKEAELILKWGKKSDCAGTATFIVDQLTESPDQVRKRINFEELE